MCIIKIYCKNVYHNSSVWLLLITMCVFIPLSVNDCNLRKVYTIAPRGVRQMEKMMTYGKQLDSASNRPVVMRFQLI
jgi:hypothetical protein